MKHVVADTLNFSLRTRFVVIFAERFNVGSRRGPWIFCTGFELGFGTKLLMQWWCFARTCIHESRAHRSEGKKGPCGRMVMPRMTFMFQLLFHVFLAGGKEGNSKKAFPFSSSEPAHLYSLQVNITHISQQYCSRAERGVCLLHTINKNVRSN